jgi:hypothetical protein
MEAIRENTRATEVITGHNNEGPCKHWGYVRFETKERESLRSVGDVEPLTKQKNRQDVNRIAVVIRRALFTQNVVALTLKFASLSSPDKLKQKLKSKILYSKQRK